MKAARLQRAKEAEKTTAPPAKKRLFASRVPSFQDCLSPAKDSESGMSSPASSLRSSSSLVSPEIEDENDASSLASNSGNILFIIDTSLFIFLKFVAHKIIGEKTSSLAKESVAPNSNSSQNHLEFPEATVEEIMALDTGEETPRKKVKKLESTIGELQTEIEGYKEKIASLESEVEEYKSPAEDRLAKRKIHTCSFQI